MTNQRYQFAFDVSTIVDCPATRDKNNSKNELFSIAGFAQQCTRTHTHSKINLLKCYHSCLVPFR